jgi:hypothetical protein
MEKPEHKLDLRRLGQWRKNKVSGKSEYVVTHNIKELHGNNKSIYYSFDWNEYFLKDKSPALAGEALLKALEDVRWEFSVVEKGKDVFPPTPENIELKRKELIADAMAQGINLTQSPETLLSIYQRCAMSDLAQGTEQKRYSNEIQMRDALLPR